MIAEIISVGTELLLGNIVNTNAQYISKQLADLGIEVHFQTTVGDNPKRIRSVLDIAYSRADLCILTGGLGPTKDDITREMIIAYFNKKPVMDEESVANMRERLNMITDETLRESLLKCATVPDESIIMHNHNGLSPGSIMEDQGRICILLPGVPKEMKPMFEEYVIPYLRKLSDQVLVSVDIKLLDFKHASVEEVGEAPVAAKLGTLLDGTNPTVATYIKDDGNLIRITAKASDEETALEMIRPVIDACKKAVGEQFIQSVSREEKAWNM
jgi:nicotinamide-nucleotide amidase